MIATLKGEFLKLLTVRSTYILTLFVLVVVSLLSFFVSGRLAEPGTLLNPNYINNVIFMSVDLFTTFAAIIAILLVTHEYRYNTIMYTLTAARKRLSVLTAKTIVMLSYGIVVGLVVAVTAFAFTRLGLASVGETLIGQQFDFYATLWRLASYSLGFILIGIILGLLIRGVVGAIVVFFLIPIAEQLISLFLKEDSKYLPFQTLAQIPQTDITFVAGGGEPLSSLAALALGAVYVAVLGVIAAWLFVRRDAN